MIDFLKSFYRPNIKPLNYVKIYKDTILHNLWTLQWLAPESEIFPVLKSNAYGHWLKEVSAILRWTKCKYICVDSFGEYQIVKKYAKKKVLVLSETRKQNYTYYGFKNTTFCIYNLETLKYLISLNERITIHLFINTWMNREGFQEEELKKALLVLKNSKIIIEWVCSHFASADEQDMSFYDSQITQFKYLYDMVISYGFCPIYRHIWASSGVLKMKDNFFTAIRPWVSLFGINTLEKWDKYYKNAQNLQLCMEIFSTVISIQKIKSWEWIWYNLTYVTEKNTKIATVAFWYYEWLDRKLSNNYEVLIWWKAYPIRWKISMNMCMVEIWEDDIEVWDEVCIVSKNKSDKNTFYNMADKSQTIPYESMVKIQKAIRRIVL